MAQSEPHSGGMWKVGLPGRNTGGFQSHSAALVIVIWRSSRPLIFVSHVRALNEAPQTRLTVNARSVRLLPSAKAPPLRPFPAPVPMRLGPRGPSELRITVGESRAGSCFRVEFLVQWGLAGPSRLLSHLPRWLSSRHHLDRSCQPFCVLPEDLVPVVTRTAGDAR